MHEKINILNGVRMEKKEKSKNITTNLDLILSLNEKLARFSEELKRVGYEKIKSFDKYKPQIIGSLKNIKAKEPNKFVFIDAGSQEIPLAMDSLYLLCALSINEKGEKRFKGPYIKTTPEIREEESDIVSDEGYLRVRDVVSLIREELIFELAVEEIEDRDPDVIVIDGPLIIRDAFLRLKGLNSFKNFLNSVEKLRKLSEKKNIPVIGFVKRPQSKFYIRTQKFPKEISNLRDPVFLDLFLNQGEFFPSPPTIPEVKSFKEISCNYYYTYYKPQDKGLYPPFRIDFNKPALKNYKEWLKWFFDNSGPSTRGLPYMLDKVDKEVKVKEILSNHLYKEMMRKIPFNMKYLCKLQWGEEIERNGKDWPCFSYGRNLRTR